MHYVKTSVDAWIDMWLMFAVTNISADINSVSIHLVLQENAHFLCKYSLDFNKHVA